MLKKRRKLHSPYCQEREVGDVYTYLAFKRKTQFFICFVVGKWNDLTCNSFYELLAGRLRFPTMKRRITIFSDGNRQNFTGIANNFPQCTYNHAIRKKIRINQEIVGVVSKVISGRVNKTEIGITQVDGFCSKLRERISCFTRKARSFAKRKLCIEQRLEIFSVQHNFIEMKKGKTPAMKECLQSKALTWETFFQIRLSILNQVSSETKHLLTSKYNFNFYKIHLSSIPIWIIFMPIPRCFYNCFYIIEFRLPF